MMCMTTSFVLIAFLASFGGCSSSQDAAPSAPEAGSSSDSQEAKIAEAMGKLSAEDRTAAEKQKTCPVDDIQLGTMGAPLKVNVQETDVFICCAACEAKLKENPDEYLSKLK